MKLSADAFDVVSKALADAFSDRGDFAHLARAVDARLDDLVAADARNPLIVLALIEYAEKRDRIDQLLAAARSLNSTNRLLKAVNVAELGEAPAPSEVVDAGDGAAQFNERLKAALADLEVLGMQVAAAHTLTNLLRDASDADAETLLLTLLGTVKTTRPDEVIAELVPVVSASLRRRLGAGSRPAGITIDLARSRLRRVDLANLDLHEADVAFADLRHADLTNVNLWRVRGYAVDLTKARLSQSNLEEARLHAAVAAGARFHDCRMVSVFLKAADLRGAEFQGSRLQGAHFEQADLTGARFEGANIADAFFAGATIDSGTAKSIALALNWEKARIDPHVRKLIEQILRNGT